MNVSDLGVNRRTSVTFKLSGKSNNRNFDSNNMCDDHLKSINSNLSIASQSYFNHRYNDYLLRVSEVNKAKEMLKTNRSTMSLEVKKRMIDHIKHKMNIIAMIE